jgi:hypothetical protein
MGTQKNARCIEVEVGRSMVALCLALNANHAKEVHEHDGGNGSEYGDWTEVTDGSKHTRRETADKVFDDARKFAWKTLGDIGQSLRNKRAAHGKNRSNGPQASVTPALVADNEPPKPSSYAPHQKHRAPILQLTDAPMKPQPAQTEIIHESASGEISLPDSTDNRGPEGNAEMLRDSSKSAKSASTGSSSIQNVSESEIVTRAAKAQAPASKKAIEATNNMTAVKQNEDSSKANEALNAAKQAGEAGEAGGAAKAGEAAKAGGAFKTRAAKKASDTSSSSSSDQPIAERTRSKKPRRSARLAGKNNGNKSK